LDALLPVLYLRGISTGDFQEALVASLGKDAPNLSPSVISRLTAGRTGATRQRRAALNRLRRLASRRCDRDRTSEGIEPGAVAAVVETKEAQATHRDQVREALLRDLEAARYAADRAFQQYDAADPANRHVAAEMEARWNQPLECVGEVDAKIAAHDAATPPVSEPTQAS
jgi:hypothetical protein